jgi:integrase/recombinase XerD
MISSCRTAEERVIIRTFYASGLRLSELVSLRWSDLRDGVITVIGKGQKLRRVPISESVTRDLEARRGSDDAPIFLSRTGKALTSNGMWRRVKVIAARAGIPVAPHHFRHAHAEHSLRGGATLMQVQRSLGHADPRTTMRYVAPRPEDGCAWALGEV